jgi:hypothetical protein
MEWNFKKIIKKIESGSNKIFVILKSITTIFLEYLSPLFRSTYNSFLRIISDLKSIAKILESYLKSLTNKLIDQIKTLTPKLLEAAARGLVSLYSHTRQANNIFIKPYLFFLISRAKRFSIKLFCSIFKALKDLAICSLNTTKKLMFILKIIIISPWLISVGTIKTIKKILVILIYTPLNFLYMKSEYVLENREKIAEFLINFATQLYIALATIFVAAYKKLLYSLNKRANLPPPTNQNLEQENISYSTGSIGHLSQNNHPSFIWLIFTEMVTIPLVVFKKISLSIINLAEGISRKTLFCVKSSSNLLFGSVKKVLELTIFTVMLPLRIVGIALHSSAKASETAMRALCQIPNYIFSAIGHPSFQFMLLGATIICVTAFVGYEYQTATISEEIQKPTPVSGAIKQFSSNVETGIYINNFPTLSFYKNNFSADSTVWFKFPIGTESLETIEQFSFKNGRILHKSKPIITQDNGNVIARYQVTFDLKTHLKYEKFPFSGHRMHIIMENRTVSPRELTFNSEDENLRFSDKILTENWKPKNTHVNSGYISSTIDDDNPAMNVSYPAVIYSIDFFNNSLRTIIALFLPMFLIFFVGLVSFIRTIDDPDRLRLSASITPSLVLFRLVMESLSPSQVSFTEADAVYFLLVGISLFILLFNTYIFMRIRKFKQLTENEVERRKKRLSLMSNLTLIALVAFLISALAYIGLV